VGSDDVDAPCCALFKQPKQSFVPMHVVRSFMFSLHFEMPVARTVDIVDTSAVNHREFKV